jgi:hypothetical protein
MASRLKLHEEFCEILNNRNVYFKPPESKKMTYPCIRYNLSGINIRCADDRMYKNINEYEVIVIDRDPESEIHNKILGYFPMCNFIRSYIADNLNHTVLKLYY